MQRSAPRDLEPIRSERPRLIMVMGGILLFVVGFFVTLAAIQSSHAAASSNGTSTQEGETGSPVPQSVYLSSGILVSLAGVVLATVGPVAGMVRGKA